MRLIYCTLLGGFLVSFPAIADDMPLYDVDNQCRSEWPDDAQMLNYCISEQQSAYNALKASWGNVPVQIAGLCRSEWDSSNDYGMLKYCIDEQLAASKNAASFNPN